MYACMHVCMYRSMHVGVPVCECLDLLLLLQALSNGETSSSQAGEASRPVIDSYRNSAVLFRI